MCKSWSDFRLPAQTPVSASLTLGLFAAARPPSCLPRGVASRPGLWDTEPGSHLTEQRPWELGAHSALPEKMQQEGIGPTLVAGPEGPPEVVTSRGSGWQRRPDAAVERAEAACGACARGRRERAAGSAQSGGTGTEGLTAQHCVPRQLCAPLFPFAWGVRTSVCEVTGRPCQGTRRGWVQGSCCASLRGGPGTGRREGGWAGLSRAGGELAGGLW